MRKRLLLSVFIMSIMLCSCRNSQADEAVMLGDPPTPSQVVRGFYHVYLEYAANGKLETYFQDQLYRQYTYIDEDFASYLDSLAGQTNTWIYDPILCSQAIPDDLEITGAEVIEEDIILIVTSNLENHSFRVRLSPQEQHYVIHSVQCD